MNIKTLILVLTLLTPNAGLSQIFNNISEQPIGAELKRKLNKINNNWDITSIYQSPLAGFYRVNISGGKVIYYSDTSGYFFEGDIYANSDGDTINATEANAKKNRRALISEIIVEDTITYKAQANTKAVIYVFIDVDCGACRKLHKETKLMNEFGIEVRYLAFPRAGLYSKTFQKMTTAWCSPTPKEDLDELMINKQKPLNLCDNSPVGRHYQLGQLMGIKGTPGIVLMDGTLLHGFMTAEKLTQKILKNNSKLGNH